MAERQTVPHPSQLELERALRAASAAHHEYEQAYLHGVRDEQWAGWYAAYLLGRLGDFAPPSQLTGWLEQVQSDEKWTIRAAEEIAARLGEGSDQ